MDKHDHFFGPFFNVTIIFALKISLFLHLKESKLWWNDGYTETLGIVGYIETDGYIPTGGWFA